MGERAEFKQWGAIASLLLVNPSRRLWQVFRVSAPFWEISRIARLSRERMVLDLARRNRDESKGQLAKGKGFRAPFTPKVKDFLFVLDQRAG
jgi:hypothetical protein